jgi:hypothetical protein
VSGCQWVVIAALRFLGQQQLPSPTVGLCVLALPFSV